LGTIGGTEDENHRFVYAHENLNLKVGAMTKISMVDKGYLRAIKEGVETNQLHA
jgi:hypothetical protein